MTRLHDLEQGLFDLRYWESEVCGRDRHDQTRENWDPKRRLEDNKKTKKDEGTELQKQNVSASSSKEPTSRIPWIDPTTHSFPHWKSWLTSSEKRLLDTTSNRKKIPSILHFWIRVLTLLMYLVSVILPFLWCDKLLWDFQIYKKTSSKKVELHSCTASWTWFFKLKHYSR